MSVMPARETRAGGRGIGLYAGPVPGDQSVPRPLRDGQAVRHFVCRVVVARHRSLSSPTRSSRATPPEGVHHRQGARHRLIETSNGPTVHLLVGPLPLWGPERRHLVAVASVGRRSAQCLGPVGRPLVWSGR